MTTSLSVTDNHVNQSIKGTTPTTTSRQANFAHTFHADDANKANVGGNLALKLGLVNESIITAQ